MERRPTEMLEEEHHVIQKVVSAMAVLAEQLETGENPNLEVFSNIVEFMRTYADKCHHGKEETHLFPLLEKKGVPARGCPLGILIAEHQRGRTLVSGLAGAVEAYTKEGPSARKTLLDNLRGLMDLYPNHIWKEEYLLFPMTNKVLNSQEQGELQEKFERVEKDIGTDVHHRLEELAEKLDKKIQ
jgi:hemerythrin-like domain-containing protein